MPINYPRRSILESLWLILEEPNSSNAAVAYSIFIDIVTLASVISSMMQTYGRVWLENSIVQQTGDITFYIYMADVSFAFIA